MQLGPIQEAWVKSLEEHPERQIGNTLGVKAEDSEECKFCCLGQALCVLAEAKGFKTTWQYGYLYSMGDDLGLSHEHYEQLGLFSGDGLIRYELGSNGESMTLAYMNDNGKTWPEIAAFIRANPEKIFFKSV